MTLLHLTTHGAYAAAERALTERELLARCYAQLTGQRLSVNDPLWAQAGSRRGTQVCIDLLNGVQLGADGTLTQSGNPVHRRILKQFNDVHKDWFSSGRWAYDSTFPDVYYGTVDVYDASAPAMYITRSLFAKDPLHYNSVLRGYTSLRALRDVGTVPADSRGPYQFPRLSRMYTGDPDPAAQFPAGVLYSNALTGEDRRSDGVLFNYGVPVPLVQVGALIGIQPITGDVAAATVWSDNFTGLANFNAPDTIFPQNVHQNYGGGALGDISYLISNLGHPFGYRANGAQKLPRRAIMSAFNTFMCLSGPFARESDVVGYKVTTTDTSAAPFRQSNSCLRCHVTMDGGAMTMRNLRLGSFANTVQGAGTVRIPASIIRAPADHALTGDQWPATPNPDFYRTAPTGKLFYRSINGYLIDQPVGDLDGLGTAMSNTDDYYACAARRYFKYFTGINVPLMDPLDPANQPAQAAMNDKDKEYRKFILGLGTELKTTGSLKTLVTRILQSEYYKLSGFGR